MTRQLLTAEAISLLVRSVNILLAANDESYRVTWDNLTMTRRGGYTLIALQERPAAGDVGDGRRVDAPFSTMNGR